MMNQHQGRPITPVIPAEEGVAKAVIPSKEGIQEMPRHSLNPHHRMDSRFRGNDGGTVVLVLILWALCPAAGQAAEGVSEPPASAIVVALTGEVWQTAPDTRQPQLIHLFDWLETGARLELGADADLTLAFWDGTRYRLGAGARATVVGMKLESLHGSVRRLEPVSPLPLLAPVAASGASGTRAGAVRIRGERIDGLYPSSGARCLAEQVVLRFEPVKAASQYRVELQDKTGKTLFSVATQELEVPVPSGLLESGTLYRWQVKSLDGYGPPAQGRAKFETLSSEAAQRRCALKQAAEALEDAPAVALLAEMDRRLGLLKEAQQEFQAALKKAPEDPALRQALQRLEAQLAGDVD